MSCQSADYSIELLLVGCNGGFQLFEWLAQSTCLIGKCPCVLGQARATPARASRKKFGTNSWIEPEHAHHSVYIGPRRFADVCHGIHERKPCRQECVCRVFGELGGGDVGDYHRRTEHVVELTESAAHHCLADPNQYSVGMEKVGYCAPFPQELRIRCDVHIVSGDDCSEAIRCTNRNR